MKLKHTLLATALGAVMTAPAMAADTVQFYINGEITVATCTIADAEKVKTFDLATITIDKLAASDSESTESASQTVTLTCPPLANLKLTLSDNNSSSSTNAYLVNGTNPNGTGTASNAAIRMYYDNQTSPIKMKTSFATVKTTSQGTVQLPFTAKYFNPAGGTLSTGTVRAAATLTIDYE